MESQQPDFYLIFTCESAWELRGDTFRQEKMEYHREVSTHTC